MSFIRVMKVAHAVGIGAGLAHRLSEKTPRAAFTEIF